MNIHAFRHKKTPIFTFTILGSARERHPSQNHPTDHFDDVIYVRGHPTLLILFGYLRHAVVQCCVVKIMRKRLLGNAA